MSLLRDIQNAAIDESVSAATVLRKCKVLAVRLGHEPFKDWIDHELNGYPLNAILPDYRVLKGIGSKGDFIGAGKWMKNVTIPLSALPQESRKNFAMSKMYGSIAEYEHLIKSKDGELICAWPGDVTAYLEGRAYKYMTCVSAWQVISTGSIVGLVDTVRTKILNFVLEIEEQYPAAGESEIGARPIPEQAVGNVFYTYIMSSGNNFSLGGANVNQLSLVEEGNLESLKGYFYSIGLNSEDISELEGSINDDIEPKERLLL